MGMSPDVTRKDSFRKFRLGLGLCLAACGFFASPVKASTTVNVMWNAIANTNIAGYKLYYGTVSQQYTNAIVAGNVTNTSISGILPGTTYYFAATSYNAAGWESAYSLEIAYTVPAVTALLVSITPALGGVNLAINGKAALPYVILASTDLVNWVALATNAAPFIFTDTNSSSYPRRFYQAVPQ
jgi:hypothetical protein